LDIREAQSGDLVKPGEVLIAPGGKNLEFFPKGQDVITKVSEPKGHQRYLPSVDMLFSSSAAVFGDRLLGVVLTGMGNDGAMGVTSIKSNGGKVFAEAEETSVVFGMPKEAIATGAVDRVVPLSKVCKEILHFCDFKS
jgi:two-component system chemotaxis response regulator CheB